MKFALSEAEPLSTYEGPAGSHHSEEICDEEDGGLSFGDNLTLQTEDERHDKNQSYTLHSNGLSLLVDGFDCSSWNHNLDASTAARLAPRV
jgi:hypothetical protein